MAEKKPKKISELDKIEHISDDDLLLISDYDNNACLSKKMYISQLVNYVVSAIATNEQIMQQLKNEVKNVTADRVEEIVQQNSDTILDLLDGEPNGQLVMGDNT